MSETIAEVIEAEGLPDSYAEVVSTYWQPLATHIARAATARKPLIVGINGAQGTGKSTVCRLLEPLLSARGLRTVTLSLDDLYLTKTERADLARNIHPLFATRGVPGTHATGIGLAIFEAVLAGRTFTLPRFDKAKDDRATIGETVFGPVDVLLFEGWCVGCAPQPLDMLAKPANAMEKSDDPNAIWRRLVNRFLAGDYAKLFGLVDMLVMLKVDSFDRVLVNRAEQEAKLRAANPDAPGLMDEAALARFVAHYERLTRWMLADMPARADIVFDIGEDQRPLTLPDGLSASASIS